MAAHSVDFINEDDARGIFLALLEQVAHAAGAYAHKHFYEIRSGDREERHAGLARDGPRQQSLAGAGRADKQHALGNTPAQLLKFLRLTQELDNLLQLLLGLLDARDILARHLLLLRRMQPRATLAEAQRLVAAALHLPHHENPERQQQNEGRGLHQQRKPRIGVGVLDIVSDVALLELIVECRIIRGDYGAQSGQTILVNAMHLITIDGNFLDFLVSNLFLEVTESDLLFGAALSRSHHSPKQDRYTDKDYPENCCLDIRVHETSTRSDPTFSAAITIDVRHRRIDSKSVTGGSPGCPEPDCYRASRRTRLPDRNGAPRGSHRRW